MPKFAMITEQAKNAFNGSFAHVILTQNTHGGRTKQLYDSERMQNCSKAFR